MCDIDAVRAADFSKVVDPRLRRIRRAENGHSRCIAMDCIAAQVYSSGRVDRQRLSTCMALL